MDHILLLSAAGLVAGAMNALAGGGSFVSLPALIAAGLPSVQANASSTVALFPGGLASAWAYRDGLGPVGAVALRPLLIATLIGGAVGIMMMAVWSLLDSRDLKSLNAPRTLMVSVTNAIAVLIFILADAVHWRETVVMLLAAIVGGYGGALIGRRASPKVIRTGTLLLTAGITLAFFVRAYLPALSRH
jgi:uncharacterized membrane protein YfcA